MHKTRRLDDAIKSILSRTASRRHSFEGFYSKKEKRKRVCRKLLVDPSDLHDKYELWTRGSWLQYGGPSGDRRHGVVHWATAENPRYK